MWKWIGNHFVPKFPVGYTIGAAYAQDFKQRYGVDYKIVRNATILRPLVIPEKKHQFILYQGAVNVGRCFEQLIPAMKYLDVPLVICGEGNFYDQAVALSKEYGVEEKVTFKGYVQPADLRLITEQAWVGITLFEDTSISNRLSLANRFFDYMHNGVPQICDKFAEYVSVNEKYEVACLVEHPSPESIAEAINSMKDKRKYDRLQANCIKAREEFCWQQEAKTLIGVYKQF
jgi:glycosyltransferase involved in cell wall biosynthesis